MNTNNTEFGLREVSASELRTVEGGWGPIIQNFLRLAASQPPSRKDEIISCLTPSEQAK